MSINDVKVSTRIWFIVSLTAIGLALSVVVAVINLRQSMLEDHQRQVKYVVDSAMGIVTYWGQQASSGAISQDEAKRLAALNLRQMQFNGGDYIFVYQSDGHALVMPGRPELEGTDISDFTDPNGVKVVQRLLATAKDDKGEFVHYSWPKAGHPTPLPKLSIARHYPAWSWVIGSGIYLDNMETAIQDSTEQLIFASLLLLLVILVLAGLVVHYTVRPLRLLTERMGRLARQDLSVEVIGADWHSEIGEMARAMVVFKDNAIEKLRLEEARKQDELRNAAEQRRHTRELADQFELAVGGIVEGLSSASAELDSTASTLAGSAKEASRQSEAVASGATEASSNVQTVAAATEELTASIAEISQLVVRSSNVAREAVTEAEHSNSMVQTLAQAAERIGVVVSLITDIASQTNLLALNATIEAARAGDAGKGFAVVAGEVKALANQTAKATDEIAQQVASIQAATGNSVQAINQVRTIISGISEISTTIAGAIEEQSAAAQEISRNIQQAAAGADLVSHNITGVEEVAQETGTAATELQHSAHDLAERTAQLRLQVDNFLSGLRQSAA